MVDLGIFGAVNLSVQQRLDMAYRRFRGFCTSRKIRCSQPPFTEKMDTWTKLGRVLLLLVNNVLHQV